MWIIEVSLPTHMVVLKNMGRKLLTEINILSTARRTQLWKSTCMRKDTFYWPIFPRKFGQKNCLKLKPSHFLVTTVAKKKQNCTKHRLLPKSLNRLHSETKYVLHLIFLIARMTISSPPWLSLRNAKTVVQMAHGWNYHKSSQRTFQHGKSIGQNTRSLIM